LRNYPRDPAPYLHPHNNTRLTHLCGPADAHLRTIEVALGVKIAHRHEQFKIDGPKAKANEALELLQASMRSPTT
jgi:phosphate starvation-inducible PhoH-like protein